MANSVISTPSIDGLCRSSLHPAPMTATSSKISPMTAKDLSTMAKNLHATQNIQTVTRDLTAKTQDLTAIAKDFPCAVTKAATALQNPELHAKSPTKVF